MRHLLAVTLIFTTSLAHSQAALQLPLSDDPEIPKEAARLTYVDKATNITITVEADRRHVTATDRDGAVLWRREPFKDAKLEPYRFRHPWIAYLGPPPKWDKEREGNDRFAELNFNSTQAGTINVKSGDFHYLGQD